MSLRYTLSLFIFLVASVRVVAYPSYLYNIPNGFRVECPGDVSGCSDGDATKGQPAKVCGGIGHMSCAGHDQRNAFGNDFEETDYEWTRELCERDSDGDGFTNGEELGDPCCLWSAYDKQSPYMQTFVPSHPGFAHHTQPQHFSRVNCSVSNESLQPALRAPKLNAFNDNEEQRVMEFIVDSYEIPAQTTTYVNFVWNFDDTNSTDSKFHAIYGEAIVHQPDFFHHMTISACKKRFPDEWHGKPVTEEVAKEEFGSGGADWKSSIFAWASPELAKSQGAAKAVLEKYECQKGAAGFGFWAPGSTISPAPLFAGHPVGAGFEAVSFLVNIHYTNPMQTPGVISRDGWRLYYTPTLRPTTMGQFSSLAIAIANPLDRFMHPLSWFTKGLHIPPKTARFFVTRTCKIRGKGEIHLATVFYHAHLIGREMYTDVHFKNGTSIELSSETNWLYDDQFQRNLLLENVTLRKGDIVQSTCVYDSSERSVDTRFGEATHDEMCFASFQVWPAKQKLKCEGPIWTGELARGESARNIKTCRPVENALDKWSGLKKGATTGYRIHDYDNWFFSNDVDVPEECRDSENVISAGHSACPLPLLVGFAFILMSQLEDGSRVSHRL